MADIILNGVETWETCPVCGEPDAITRHGYNDTGPMHDFECQNPDCLDHCGAIYIVGYDCPDCGPRKMSPAAGDGAG